MGKSTEPLKTRQYVTAETLTKRRAWLKRSARGATRNNLIFNDVCIFRVGDPVTLKMLNPFIVSLLRGAPNGKPFSGLDTMRMLT